eukprot:11149461-Ditylum_brightwellii.AAC.1
MLDDIKSTTMQLIKGIQNVHVQTSVSSIDDTYSQLTTATGMNSEENANKQETSVNEQEKIQDEEVVEEEKDQELLMQPDKNKEEEKEKSTTSARQGYKKKTLTMA